MALVQAKTLSKLAVQYTLEVGTHLLLSYVDTDATDLGDLLGVDVERSEDPAAEFVPSSLEAFTGSHAGLQRLQLAACLDAGVRSVGTDDWIGARTVEFLAAAGYEPCDADRDLFATEVAS